MHHVLLHLQLIAYRIFLLKQANTTGRNNQQTDFQFKLQGSYHLYLNKFKTSLNGLQLKVEPPHRVH